MIENNAKDADKIKNKVNDLVQTKAWVFTKQSNVMEQTPKGIRVIEDKNYRCGWWNTWKAMHQ